MAKDKTFLSRTCITNSISVKGHQQQASTEGCIEFRLDIASGSQFGGRTLGRRLSRLAHQLEDRRHKVRRLRPTPLHHLEGRKAQGCLFNHPRVPIPRLAPTFSYHMFNRVLAVEQLLMDWFVFCPQDLEDPKRHKQKPLWKHNTTS